MTIQFSPRHCALIGQKEFGTTKSERGFEYKIDQPIFRVLTTSSTVTLRDGEHRLVYSSKPAPNEEDIILFIVGVKLIPQLGK